MAVRATHDVIASLSIAGAAHTLVTQIRVEAHATADANVLATQIKANTWAIANSSVHATQVRTDAWFVPVAKVDATRIVLEVLIWARPTWGISPDGWEGEILMPDVFPTLAGLGFSVIKRPKFFTSVGTSQSGREVRYGYAVYPLWEWDLTWPDFLPDYAAAAATTPSDFKTLIGFYLAQQGALRAFLFDDPDDNRVTGQIIGTGDGITTNWTLVRTFGGSDGSSTEAIGYVNNGVTFNVYLNGVLKVNGVDYNLDETHPVLQLLKFPSAPADGVVITVDMGYYFYVRFKEDHYDFEKFMDKLWSQKMITLMSQRG